MKRSAECGVRSASENRTPNTEHRTPNIADYISQSAKHLLAIRYPLSAILIFSLLFLTGMSPLETKRREADRLYEKGDFHAAAHVFQEIIRQDPADLHNRLNLIDCYRFLGDGTSAEKAGIELAASGKNSAERLLWCAQQEEDYGRMSDAVNLYQQMLTVNPEFDRGRVEYSACLLRCGRAEDAFKEIGILAHNPENQAEILWLSALYYRLAGEYKAADPFLEAVLTVTPRDSFAQAELYRNRRSQEHKPYENLYFRDNPDFFMRSMLMMLFDGVLGPVPPGHWLSRADDPLHQAGPGLTAIISLLQLKQGKTLAAVETAATATTRWPAENFCHLAAGICRLRHFKTVKDEKLKDHFLILAQDHFQKAFRASRRFDDPHLYKRILFEFFPALPTEILKRVDEACTRYPTDLTPPYTPAELFDLTLR